MFFSHRVSLLSYKFIETHCSPKVEVKNYFNAICFSYITIPKYAVYYNSLFDHKLVIILDTSLCKCVETVELKLTSSCSICLKLNSIF